MGTCCEGTDGLYHLFICSFSIESGIGSEGYEGRLSNTISLTGRLCFALRLLLFAKPYPLFVRDEDEQVHKSFSNTILSPDLRLDENAGSLLRGAHYKVVGFPAPTSLSRDPDIGQHKLPMRSHRHSTR
jgi:hypothetical protein